MAKKEQEEFSTTKRDFLRDIERSIQREWEENKVFEADAPADLSEPKFFATFPYPYMNGRLHLGHSFTLSKAEFASAYQRLKGRNVLFPFGFHCTGMPIKACADRLKREINDFGCPPDFPEDKQPAEIETTDPPAEEKPKNPADNKKADPLAHHSKKSKAAAKSSGVARQWKIMKSLGVKDEEISKFSDASYWLSYFPPLCESDLKSMGLGVDWRRSFITTDVNPYYDSFVKWQFETLRDLGKVKFGKRYTIWSPTDGQPCMDHDRASGEGVLPQEYTLIKLEVTKPFPEKLASLEGKYNVYLVPGTLRPETMYGQTNCWVLPDGAYVAAKINDKDVFICTERAARNMAYQELSKEEGKVEILARMTGWDLIGTLVNAPLSIYKQVYVLPMMSIDPEKGTGVVTSVPSDAPDDYAALHDVQKKKEYFLEKYKVKPEWAAFDPVPIINVPEFGDLSAVKACADLKIKSQNDRALLDQAKELVYTKGFYDGVMLVGEHKGMKVKDAKPIIKEEMIKAGTACMYSEPAGKVMSRSGDECVVALKDQWYMTYGEKDWRAQTEAHLQKLETYSEETKKQFEIALGWMNQWACSRTYGLGTRLPWDPQYLIESLSDSTIYMAFYTVAHFLQGGVINGTKVGPAGIKPEQMTNAVWEYLFRNGPFPETTIPRETLEKLKREFNYWYPVDIRISGKDLIQNHLTFFLYTHCAMFPEAQWPRSIRTNGHILLNGRKMSKNEGNFITAVDAVERFSADGMRYGLAAAGDSNEDANFTDTTADAAILRLYAQTHWTQEVVANVNSYRTGPITLFADRVFESAINKTIAEADYFYERTQFREALRVAFFEFQTARDHYKNVLEGQGQPLHRDLILRFIEVQALLIAPICPHFAEKCWKILGKQGSILKARWPKGGEVDTKAIAQDTYLEENLYEFRNKIGVYKKSKAKNPNAKVTEAVITVSTQFPEWQQKVLSYLQSVYNKDTRSFVPDEQIVGHFKQQKDLEKYMQKIMSLIMEVKKQVVTQGSDALRLAVPFDEKEFIESNMAYVTRSIEVPNIRVEVDDPKEPKTNAIPGKPNFTCVNHVIQEKEKKEKK